MYRNRCKATTSLFEREPRLPQELERIIFEIAARNDMVGTLPALLLIARRVHAWLNPIRYEIMAICVEDYCRDFPKPFSHHRRIQHPLGPQGALVKHLLFDTDDHSGFDWDGFLPTCYNLQTLALWSDSTGRLVHTLQNLTSAIFSPLRTISPPGLLHLSASLVGLFPGGAVDWTHPILKDITHLDVLDHPHVFGEWKARNNIAFLRNLKYLAFGDIHEEHPFPLEFLTKCLGRCKSLELLILPNEDIVSQNEAALPQKIKILDSNGRVKLVPEDRVVIDDKLNTFEGWVADWCRGSSGGDDIWTRCERIVEQRRQDGDLDDASSEGESE
ncbi:hypothetical protein AX16_007141 [Volvariella volvacea WC 439]|nr:hypothetical protein AX16_007141 [Volvariella volvacea WC 439]